MSGQGQLYFARFYKDAFIESGLLLHMIAVFILMMLGGLCYSAGSIIYGMKRPNFSTQWFGFHELFHALTAAAFTFQFIAAAIVVYQHK